MCKQFTDKDQQPSGSEGEDDDVEAVLKKEVGDIKASTEMRLRRFQSVESGANNVVFIRTLGIGVSDSSLQMIDAVIADVSVSRRARPKNGFVVGAPSPLSTRRMERWWV